MPLPQHVSSEPRPADRGRGFGAARADQVELTVRTYRRMLREAAGLGDDDLLRAGETVGARLDEHWPELVLELEGVAAGARQDVRDLLAINARTELLALAGAPGECSLLAAREPGGAWLAQTWDWHPDLAAAAVVWTVRRPGGGWWQTVTEAGVLAKLGHNSDAVACGLNFLTCSADGGLDGVPVHVLLRLVLERCADGAAARALLCAERTAASSCVTVATQTDLFAAELSPGGAQLVEPGEDGRLAHTNHFLRAPRRGADTQPATHPGTLARLEALRTAGGDPTHALAQHLAGPEPVCRHGDPPGTPWADRRATLVAIWARPAKRSLRVAGGPPCQTPFAEVSPLADGSALG